MEIKLNGKAAEVPEMSSVADLVRAKEMAVRTLVVELNGDIVAADGWDGTRLQPHDDVVLVRLVGGG